jgi:hypothetical protein
LSAASSALTQGIGYATGLQKGFDWKSVAVSAIAAPLAKYVTSSTAFQSFAGAFGATHSFGNDLVTNFTQSIINAGVNQAVRRDNSIDWRNLSINAFAQTVAGTVQGQMSPERRQQNPWDVQNNRYVPYTTATTPVVNVPSAADTTTVAAVEAPDLNGVQAFDLLRSTTSRGLNLARSGEGFALLKGLRDEFDQDVYNGMAHTNAAELTDAQKFAEALQLAYGDGYETVPTGGGTRNKNNSRSSIGLAEMRTNGRANSFFTALSDWADASLVGNPTSQYRDDADVLSRGANKSEIDRIRERFGLSARNAPEVGKAWDASGRLVDDFSTNNVERFKS